MTECRECGKPARGSYAKARLCPACYKERKSKKKRYQAVEAALSLGYVIECWKGEDGKYVCLASNSHGDEKQYRGWGASLDEATSEAMAEMREVGGE